MKTATCVSLVLMALGLLACAAEPPTVTLVHEDAERSPARALASPITDDTLVARDEAGVLRFVDARTLEVVAGIVPGDLDGDVDVSLFSKDGELTRVALMEHDEEDQLGRLSVLPFTGATFARRMKLGHWEGRTRILALSDRTVIFQEDLGARWKVATGSGTSQGRACPMPLSILEVKKVGLRDVVRTLGLSPEDELVVVEARIGATKLDGCRAIVVDADPPLSRTARGVVAGEVGTVVADVAASELVVGSLEDASFEEAVGTGIAAERIEQLTWWSDGDASFLVAALTGPSQVALIEIARDQVEGLVIGESFVVPLEGTIAETWWTPGASLAIADGTVFVATSAGLEAFTIDTLSSPKLEPLVLTEELRKMGVPLASGPAMDP